MTLDSFRLTPGVLDGSAEHAFKYGACGALAIAIHDELGWPIVAVTDGHNVYHGKAGGGSAMHWLVRTPEGQLLDVDGFQSEEDLLDEYQYEADDEEAAIGTSTRADCWEWYGESQGAPVSIDLAKTLIEPVLARAGYDLAKPPRP